MEAQIFIPDFKKEHTLKNDVEILLYPLSDGLNYKTEDLEHILLYGNYKKNRFEIKYNREVLEYNNTMESDWQKGKVKDFFLICNNESQHERLKKSLEHINYPEAAIALTDSKVYVEKAFYINWENTQYTIFAKKNYERNYDYFDLEKKIFSNIDEVIKNLNLENQKTTTYYNNLYLHTLKLGSDFSNIIQDKVPIKYTINKESKIKLLKLSYKDNRSFKTKIPFSLIEVNGQELILKTEELSKFIIS